MKLDINLGFSFSYWGNNGPRGSLSVCCCASLRERQCSQSVVTLLPFLIQSFPIPVQTRQWHPTPVLLPGKSHGWRSLVGCSPWGHEELDTTEWLHFHFSLSCIGEGNGNPLQCSCLENPRDGGAWWAAVYGVAQKRTWMKWLSYSSSHSCDPGRCSSIPSVF